MSKINFKESGPYNFYPLGRLENDTFFQAPDWDGEEPYFYFSHAYQEPNKHDSLKNDTWCCYFDHRGDEFHARNYDVRLVAGPGEPGSPLKTELWNSDTLLAIRHSIEQPSAAANGEARRLKEHPYGKLQVDLDALYQEKLASDKPSWQTEIERREESLLSKAKRLVSTYCIETYSFSLKNDFIERALKNDFIAIALTKKIQDRLIENGYDPRWDWGQGPAKRFYSFCLDKGDGRAYAEIKADDDGTAMARISTYRYTFIEINGVSTACVGGDAKQDEYEWLDSHDDRLLSAIDCEFPLLDLKLSGAADEEDQEIAGDESDDVALR